MFRSEKCVWALNKSLELCILLDTLDWDGRYVKATPQLQAEYDQGMGLLNETVAPHCTSSDTLYGTASRTFFDKLKVFKVMVDSISSRSWALLLWTDRRLQFLADQESIGESLLYAMSLGRISRRPQAAAQVLRCECRAWCQGSGGQESRACTTPAAERSSICGCFHGTQAVGSSSSSMP